MNAERDPFWLLMFAAALGILWWVLWAALAADAADAEVTDLDAWYEEHRDHDPTACGPFNRTCFIAIYEQTGLGPLTTDPRTGTTRLRALHCLLRNESGLDPHIVNTKGNDPPGSRDRGIAQINDHWNRQVTNTQAFNPHWSIRWTARNLFPTARVTWHAFDHKCRKDGRKTVPRPPLAPRLPNYQVLSPSIKAILSGSASSSSPSSTPTISAPASIAVGAMIPASMASCGGFQSTGFEAMTMVACVTTCRVDSAARCELSAPAIWNRSRDSWTWARALFADGSVSSSVFSASSRSWSASSVCAARCAGVRWAAKPSFSARYSATYRLMVARWRPTLSETASTVKPSSSTISATERLNSARGRPLSWRLGASSIIRRKERTRVRFRPRSGSRARLWVPRCAASSKVGVGMQTA